LAIASSKIPPATNIVILRMPKIATQRRIAKGSSMSAQDRERYAGKYVLLRNGEVIAASNDPRTLERNPNRGRYDTVRRVPRTREVFL
jgi:hypothetical protein